MVRQILCRGCGAFDSKLQLRKKLNARMGFKEEERYVSRSVYLNLSVPRACDNCAADLPIDEIAIAVTHWRGTLKDQPRNWEEQFGTVLPEQAVRVYDTITNQKS